MRAHVPASAHKNVIKPQSCESRKRQGADCWHKQRSEYLAIQHYYRFSSYSFNNHAGDGTILAESLLGFLISTDI